MDFGISSNTSSSNNGSFSNKQKWDGSGIFLKQEKTINEDDLRDFKMAKMLSFSSPNSQTLPYYYQTSNAFTRNAAGVRGPFTPSQWMELEHQALIYKYITANVPIPSYLLNPIRNAFDSASFSTLRSNPYFHLGYPNTDPEPGRCRRTDGKKWRCSRDAVADQKYCEKHINRGRHRSRKPVEGPLDHSTNTTLKPTPPSINHLAGTPNIKSCVDNPYEESSRSEFGLVNSDSLVNPLNTTSSLRQFMDEWPKSQPDRSPTNEKLTTSPLRLSSEQNQRQQAKWIPISWEPSMGGPLGEVLHNTSECNNAKALNLIERWDNGPRLASSPTEVLQRAAFG